MPGPNYVEYHKTVTAELRAIKDRLKQLIDHRLTLGEFKEAALRAVLRRHLPANLSIGRGFVVTRESCSTQLDILVVDQSKPVLFQDGDLLVVTPDAVRAAVEVKTRLGSEAELKGSLETLGDIGKLCWDTTQSKPWLGLYVYESNLDDDTALDCLVEIAEQTRHAVNSLCYGDDRFFRYWKAGEHDRGEDPDLFAQNRFRSYRLQGLSPSYFIGNLVDDVSHLDGTTNAFAWFPLSEGKHVHMTGERVWREGGPR